MWSLLLAPSCSLTWIDLALHCVLQDKLDNVDGIARTMGHEVDDQNRIIDGLNNDMERLNNRVDVAKERVKAID